MASACFGGDVDLVVSKVRPTSSVPGRRKVLKEPLLPSTAQSYLGLLEVGNQWGFSKGEKKRKLSCIRAYYVSGSVLGI